MGPLAWIVSGSFKHVRSPRANKKRIFLLKTNPLINFQMIMI